MKTWFKYGLINAALGLAIGIYITIAAIGDDYYSFGLAAPLAAFFTASLMWMLIMKKTVSGIRVFFTGLLTGTVSHYIAFIFLSIGMNICYLTTGGCTGSLNEPSASIIDMITDGYGLTFFSLLIFGWITVPYSIIAGFLLLRVERKKIED